MSNFLAVATVTETLRQMLDAAVNNDVAGATATAVQPGDAGAAGAGALPQVGVNIYLYQVNPNAAWRNADLPTRREDGTVLQRPRAAIDLHYLLTFYGNDGQLEPQRVLGSVVRTLHGRAVLTRQMIRDTIASVAYLANSNLANGVELVKFIPQLLSLEELSKLWSVFIHVPYRLSVAYQASVVLIEAEEVPGAALPVRERLIYVRPFRHPHIDEILSDAGKEEPIVVGSKLVIRGKNLRDDITRLLLGGAEVVPGKVDDHEITLSLKTPPIPANSLRAGIIGVQVVHKMLMGTPPKPHRGVESNVAAFVLRPTITAVNVSNVQGSGTAPRSADVTVQVNPLVGKAQRVVLMLNERSVTEPAAYTFVGPRRDTDTNSIQIPISGVKTADYFLRLQLDGAESPLDLNPASPKFGPTVTIP
jgi:hypothetical protein